MATLSCQCGKVKMELTATKPRVRNECCCRHCFRRIGFLHELGGPEIPKEYEQPLLVSKWDNCVRIVSGRNQLFCYKLEPTSLVKNVASKCCHTFLLGRHPEYDTYCVTTHDDVGVFSTNVQFFPPTSRWFANQWPPERIAKLPPRIAIWAHNNDDPSKETILQGDQGWEPVFEQHKASMERPIDHAIPGGETFDEIVASLEGDIQIVPQS